MTTSIYKITVDLSALRILENCAKGHRVVGIMDGDFTVCEVHIPGDTPLRDTEAVVRKIMEGQL